MKPSKKSCLNCTFCVRNRHTWLSSTLANIYEWRYKVETLTVSERKALAHEDFNFLGADLIAAKEWDVRYHEVLEKISDPFRRLSPQFGGGLRQEDLEKHGLGPQPDAPDHDYHVLINSGPKTVNARSQWI